MLDLIYLIFGVPSLLWQYAFHGKYRSSLKERLGLKLPPIFQKKTLWIHATSVGETRAAASLYAALRAAYPEIPIIITSTTETGQAEAKRSLPHAAAYLYLPLDISWVVAAWMRRLNPHVLILVEGDIWPHLIHAAKKFGAKLCLVNGKVSARSTSRFQKLSFFSKRLFSRFDALAVQTETYKDRFLSIGADPQKIRVTGNLKYDAPLPELTPAARAQWLHDLKIKPTDRVITLGSTHNPEEEKLIAALADIPNLKVLLVPRHPERFEALSKHYPATYSKCRELSGNERVILIDAMGLLPSCYQLSELAIVGGSFAEGIGGHNIIEPLQCGIPVLFGPHMETQKEMVALVLDGQVGRQVSLDEISSSVKEILESRSHKTVEHFAKTLQGSTEKTLNFLTRALCLEPAVKD